MKLTETQFEVMEASIANANDLYDDLQKLYKKWKIAYDESERICCMLNQNPREMNLKIFEEEF